MDYNGSNQNHEPILALRWAAMSEDQAYLSILLICTAAFAAIGFVAGGSAFRRAVLAYLGEPRWQRFKSRVSLRFSLRTMFVAMTLFAILTWFVTFNVKQVRERNAILRTAHVRYNWQYRPWFQTELPLIWPMLGTKYIDYLILPSTQFTEDDAQRLKSLFPEADVSLYDEATWGDGVWHRSHHLAD